jgi:hypothetical protein
MAKRKSTAHLVPYQFRAAPAAAPIVIRQRSRAPAKAKHKHHRRSAHAGKGNLQKVMTGAAVGGFLIGFIEKQFPTLPVLPVVGKKGAIAFAAYIIAGKGGQIGAIARDVATVAAGIAGYEYGSTGKVSGGELVTQVSGLASQV